MKGDILKAMHEVMIAMDNEEAYMAWINVVPDGAEMADFREIEEDPTLREEAWRMFCDTVAQYRGYGIYWDSDDEYWR